MKRLRIQRETFNMILDEMYDKLVLQPTNLKPLPTSPDRQLALHNLPVRTWLYLLDLE